MTLLHRLKIQIMKITVVAGALCAITFLWVLNVSGQIIDYPQGGTPVVPQANPQPGFAPPNTAPKRYNGGLGIETEFRSGMTNVTPRTVNPGQLGNYVSPLNGIQDVQQPSPFPRNMDRSSVDGKTLVETTQNLELIVENYPNGAPRVKRQVTQDTEGNYFNHGSWQLLGKRQEITAEGEFFQGRMAGQWKRLHNKSENGIFATEPFKNFEGPYRSFAEFKDGKLHGVWKITDRYEQTIFEMPYQDGVRDGTATWYHTNGVKMREMTFRDGELEGPLFEWNSQEQITREEEYIGSRKIVKETQFYRPKQPLSQNFYLDTKLLLQGQDDWWNAKPSAYTVEGQRVQHGATGLWYQNGQPQMQGNFKNGKRHGVFVGWHSNGQKEVIGQFEDGEKDGKWTWWHTTGFKSVEGEFEDGTQVGEWIWWNEDGSVRNRRTMENIIKPLSETSDRDQENPEGDNQPSDEIDDEQTNSNQPEEVPGQELPEKKSDGSTEENNEVPDDVILPAIKPSETESDSNSSESEENDRSTDPPISDDPANQKAEEVESVPAKENSTNTTT